GNVDILQGIGSEVVDQPAADPEKLRIRIHPDLERPELVALLGGVGEMLAPVLDPFDWPLDEFCSGYDRDIFRIHAKFWTEAAADVWSRHPQAAFVEIEQRGQRLEQIVRLLRRGPNGHGAVAPFGKNAAAFDRMRAAAMLPKLLVKSVGGASEGGVDIAIGDAVGGRDIAV